MDTAQKLKIFFIWWLQGLSYLLPETMRNVLEHKGDRLIIKAGDMEFTFIYFQAGAQEALSQWTLERNNTLEAIDTKKRLEEILTPDTSIAVSLPRDKILFKTIALPLGALSNLREILGFEMDRQTPFKTEEVYFTWEIIEKDPARQKLKLNLMVARKSDVDAILEEFRELGVEPQSITIDEVPDHGGMNLLPADRHSTSNYISTRSRIFVPALTVVLLLVMLYAPLLRQTAVLNEMEQDVNDLRLRARTVQSLSDERTNILAKLRFLEEKRNSRIPVIEIVKELTALLPDDTWINQLSVRENELQLFGESDTATAIIQKLESSKLFSNPQFKAPITKNSATGKDRFQVSADIKSGDAA